MSDRGIRIAERLAGVLNLALGLVLGLSFGSEFARHYGTSVHLLAYFDLVGLAFGISCVGCGVLLVLGQHSGAASGVAAVMTWAAVALVAIAAVRYPSPSVVTWLVAIAAVSVASTVAWTTRRDSGDIPAR